MSREVGGGRHVVVGECRSLVVVEGQMEAETAQTRCLHRLGLLLSVKRRKIILKKTHLGPNDASGVVWALFPLRVPAGLKTYLLMTTDALMASVVVVVGGESGECHENVTLM